MMLVLPKMPDSARSRAGHLLCLAACGLCLNPKWENLRELAKDDPIWEYSVSFVRGAASPRPGAPTASVVGAPRLSHAVGFVADVEVEQVALGQLHVTYQIERGNGGIVRGVGAAQGFAGI